MASLDYLIYHRLVVIEYAKTNDPELLPFVLEKTKQHLVLRQHLADIDALFNQHGIVYVVLKGIPLNQQLYGPQLRKYSKDIDLLVEEEHLFEAHRLLLSLGYESQLLVPIEKLFSDRNRLYAVKDVVYHHPVDHSIIELHRHMSRAESMRFGDLAVRESVFVDGRSIPVLNREENFLYLCLHGAQHHWQRLIWLTDIAAFYQQMSPSWDVVVEKARQYHCLRPLLEAKILLAETFSMLLPHVPHQWRDAAAAKVRLRYARYLWSPDSTCSPLKGMLYITFLLPRWKQKWRYFIGLLFTGEVGVSMLNQDKHYPIPIIIVMVLWKKALKRWSSKP